MLLNTWYLKISNSRNKFEEKYLIKIENLLTTTIVTKIALNLVELTIGIALHLK